MSLQIKDIMTPEVVGAPLGVTIHEAARIMKEQDVGSLLIMDETYPAGIITETDFVYKVVYGKMDLQTPVDDIMVSPVMMIHVDESLESAGSVMNEKKIRRLVVTDGETVIGVLSSTDISRLSPKYVSEVDKTLEKLDELLRDL